MAALPSPTQVAGSHIRIYEAYYHQVDPNNLGSIGAIDAAKFLKKSGLSDALLGKIWDLSDPAGKGCLNKSGFFVALKLVALAQAGKNVNMVNISLDTPPPKMGDVPPLVPPNSIISPPTNSLGSIDWTVKPAEKAKYDQLFESLQPVNGLLPGNKVKGVMMDSKLPFDTLGKIWDLADMDKDGMLDRHEFTVAMHLVYKALEKYTIPNVLPPELLPPSKRKQSNPSGLPGAIPVLPNLTLGMDGTKPPLPPVVPPPPVAPWVVTAEEKAKYDILFTQTDIDKDGFVSGIEIKDVFLQSGVPQTVLADIWSLCDIKQTGKLNSEQFALAMWMINQKIQGIDPPTSLTPEMVPPMMRPKPGIDGVLENSSAPYTNPELDMISREIEELANEKHQLETDIAQKEADIKIKTGEIKSLQSELDTLAATLKQLENQKGEAQKRLNDLNGQKSVLDKELNDMKEQLEEEQMQVNNLRRQAEEQESNLKTQEDELSSKKQELDGLKQEETRLEQQLQSSRQQMDSLTKNLQDTQLQISQAKAKITQLQEQQRQMNDAICLYDSAISIGTVTTITDSSLAPIKPEFRDPEFAMVGIVNGETTIIEEPKDPFSSLNGPVNAVVSEPFGNGDMFANDPFNNPKPVTPAADPFGASDPFAGGFAAEKPVDSGFTNDPFASFGAPAVAAKNDPFDPFGTGAGGGGVRPGSGAKTPIDMDGKDPFGCDPFAAPPVAARTESPTPALPPKKSKQPPPRPAPPKHIQPKITMRAAPLPPAPSSEPLGNNPGEPGPDLGTKGSSDPFGAPSGDSDPFGAGDPFSSNSGNAFSGGAGGFADFANFDSKCCHRSNIAYPYPTSRFSYRSPQSVISALTNWIKSTFDWKSHSFSETAIESPWSSAGAGAGTWPSRKPAEKKMPGANQHRYADLEFTEDPFKNYRYEDPFNIVDPFSQDEDSKGDPFGEKHSLGFTNTLKSDSVITSRRNNEGAGMDPFTKRLSPLGSSSPRDSKSPRCETVTKSSKAQPKLPPEDEQLAWAAAESLRLEDERCKRLEQEQADLEYALALSRTELAGVPGAKKS